MADYVCLPLSEIHPSPWNTRKDIDEGLVESLKATGQVEPLKVRRVGEAYELISGHRRLAGLKAAGIPFADCIIEQLGDDDVLLQQWAENEERLDLGAYEKALKLKQMMDYWGLSQRGLAEKIGKSFTWVNRHMSLLSLEEVLPIGNTLYQLSESQGRAILTAPEDFRVTIGDAIESYLENEDEMPTAEQIIDMIAVEMQRREDEAKKNRNKNRVEPRASSTGNSMAQRIDEELGPKPHKCEADEGKTACRECGRLLSDPESVANGIGPVCAGNGKKHEDAKPETRPKCSECGKFADCSVMPGEDGCEFKPYHPTSHHEEVAPNTVEAKVPSEVPIEETKLTPKKTIEKILRDYPDAKDTFIQGVLKTKFNLKDAEARAHLSAYRRGTAPPSQTPIRTVNIYVISPTGKIAATHPFEIPVPEGYTVSTEIPAKDRSAAPSPQVEELKQEAV